MNYSRTLTPICLLATALLALAQTPTPRAVPAPLPAPMPMPTPIAPLPPMDIDLGDLDAQVSLAKEMAKEMAERYKPELQEQLEAAKEQLGRMKLDLAFAAQNIAVPRPPTPPRPAKEITFRGRGMIDDSFYARGQSALDNRQWDQALDYFGQVISRNGSRVDGALYWKAYAASRWLDDAKALELELKQASGQNVSPEAESDEELKLMAINGLMQSD